VQVALLVTCLVDGLFPDVGKATVGLLERLGHQVEVPLAQTCCGQMHVNTGYAREALPLVRRHVEVFSGYQAVVVPSGSCAGWVRHQYAWVARQAGDAGLAAAAEAVASRTYELSEFLVDVLGVTDVGAYYPHRVTYHPTTRPATRCGCCGSATVRRGCSAPSPASTWSSCRRRSRAAASAAPSR
jgi:L-lactate dehydrogenase complex protein LldE